MHVERLIETVNFPPNNNISAIHRGFCPSVLAFLCIVLLGTDALQAQTVVGTDAAGQTPYSVAVNPVTGKVYVTNINDTTVTVIDGTTNSISTVNVGGSPSVVAVNPATNKIHVADLGGSSLVVIDGANNSTSTVNLGGYPASIAVNPVTNKIYGAVVSPNSLTVIDGVTNVPSTVSVGAHPYAVAANPVTNKIYVANSVDGTVSVIDAATNGILTVPVGTAPGAIVINLETNKIYIADQGDATVTVIEGATNGTATVAAGSNPFSIAVNPETNRIYVTNQGSSTVTVIDVDGSRAVPLTAVSAIAPNDPLTVSTTAPYVTRNATPLFTATVSSAYSTSSAYNGLGIADPVPTALYYWVDDGSAVTDRAAEWAVASETATTVGQNPGVFSLAIADQSIGLHTLYYFAAYGGEGVSDSMQAGGGNSPAISNLQQIVYEVLPAITATTLTADVNPQNAGGRITFAATIAPGSGRTAGPGGCVYFYDGPVLMGSAALASGSGTYTAAYATSTLAAGSHTISASSLSYLPAACQMLVVTGDADAEHAALQPDRRDPLVALNKGIPHFGPFANNAVAFLRMSRSMLLETWS